MKFQVIANNAAISHNTRNRVFLREDLWDDWFTYSTMYTVLYFDENGVKHRIGEVKIGQFKMAADQRRPEIPPEFSSLDEECFSLGQDDTYYETLNEIGADFREAYLNAMRDVAHNEDLFNEALNEKVTRVSLLRSVSEQSVTGQFRRMARGGARLTKYSFSYTPPPWGKDSEPPVFEFSVVPSSYPPTNVHVLIGRNNVGKTYTVDQMANALVRPKEGVFGDIFWIDDSREKGGFASVISVAFSAFDPFEPLPVPKDKLSSARYQYIGLKHTQRDSDGKPKPPKSPDDLATDFGMSVQQILAQSAKRSRWEKALSLLESDPIFKEAEIWSTIVTHEAQPQEYDAREAARLLREQARKVYKRLSSGHKIVVLTITRLVEVLEERSLVLVDEPEAHLHPPLLSAFIRTLSELLSDRNGVAIIATHSPVILQEVPRTCVWRLWRSGTQKSIERPVSETFGENVGTLTQAIFGLEVTESGFHRMLSEAVSDGLGYDELLQLFQGHLGDEARAIARALIATRDRGD